MNKIGYVILLLSLGSVAHSAPLVFSEKDTSIILNPAQTSFTIELKSNKSTGYAWFLNNFDIKFLSPVSHKYVTKGSRMGSTGSEQWTFKINPQAFLVPQLTEIRFTHLRPWALDTAQAVTFTLLTTDK